MALQFTVVDMPFNGSLQEGTDAQHVDMAGFTKVTNGWYEKGGRISKRPGITRRVTGTITNGSRLARRGDGLYVIDGTTGIYAYSEAGTSLTLLDDVSEATAERRDVTQDISQPLVPGDVAVANGYGVYVWHRDDDQRNNYRTVEMATGVVVDTNRLTTSANVGEAQAASTGNFIAVAEVRSAGSLWLTVWDCSTDPPTKGGTTQLVAANVNAGQGNLDICGLPSDRFALAYINSATGNPTLIEVTLTGTTPAVNTTATIAAVNATAPACQYTQGNNLFVGYHDVSNAQVVYAVYNQLSWASVVAATNIQATAGADRISFAPFGADELMSWHEAPAVAGVKVSQHQWIDIVGLTAPGTAEGTTRTCPVSKIFVRSSRLYQWVRADAGSLVGTQFAYALVEIATGANFQSRPITTAVYGAPIGYAVAVFPSTIATGPHLRNVAVSGTAFHVMLTRTMFAAAGLTGVIEVVTRFASINDWEPRFFAGDTYLSGGMLSQITPGSVIENNYVQPPKGLWALNVGAGALSVGSYQYAITFERIEPNGNVARSAPYFTPAITAAANDAGDVTVLHNTLTLYEEGAPGSAIGPPQSIIGIYRTLANGKNFYLIADIDAYAHENDHSQGTTLQVITDTASDASIKDNLPLYTLGGVLENDPVYGGCTAIAVHKSRLWAANSEQRDTLWYSQLEVGAEPALFNLAQTIRVSGRRINQIESLDDALIVFTEEPNGAIYAIFGEGPDNTGAVASGSFSDPVPIATDCGCKDPRSVIATPVGIFFRSDKGFTLLDRQRQVRYVGAPVEDTLASFPTVRWSVLYPSENQVRFGCDDGATTVVLVYDWVQNKWSRWEYGSLLFMDAAPMRSGNIALLTSAGDLYEEIPTQFTDIAASTTAIQMTIETGWISFGSLQGFKRLRRVSVLGNRVGAHGLSLRVAYNYNTTYATTMSFSESAVTAFDHEQARFHMPRQKGAAWRFELTDTAAATPGAGVNFTGLSFQVGLKGGLHRQPAAEST